jgi:hypothetical protein
MTEDIKKLLKQAFLDGVEWCRENVEVSETDGWSRCAPHIQGPAFGTDTIAAEDYINDAIKEFNKGKNDV